MTVRRSWHLEYDADDVLRGQAADPATVRARSPRLVEFAERALASGRDLVEPAVLSRKLRVEGVRHGRLVLEGGQIVGRGTHASLSASCQTYIEIVESQLRADVAS